MKSSNRPAGPGKPTTERRDAAVEQEELNEATGEADSGDAVPPGSTPPNRDIRQAERDAHTGDGGANKGDQRRNRAI